MNGRTRFAGESGPSGGILRAPGRAADGASERAAEPDAGQNRRIELAAEDVVVAWEEGQGRVCERVGHLKIGFDVRSLAPPDYVKEMSKGALRPGARQPGAQDGAPTAELRALTRLNANWRSVVEGSAFARETETRITGQRELTLESDGR